MHLESLSKLPSEKNEENEGELVDITGFNFLQGKERKKKHSTGFSMSYLDLSNL